MQKLLYLFIIILLPISAIADVSGTYDDGAILTLRERVSSISNNSFTGIGTSAKPCQLFVPEDYEFDVNPSKTDFQWKGGWFFVKNVEDDTALQDYAVLSPDNTTLTFRHDNKKSEMTGTVFGIYNGQDSPEWYDNRSTITKVVFDSSFSDARPTSTLKWFSGMTNLASIEGLQYLNTSEVLYMSYMFYSCKKIETLNLSGFDTQKVQLMGYMFQGCSSLKDVNLSSFNTAANTSFYRMFMGCTSLEELNISSFTFTKNVESRYFLNNCTGLKNLTISTTMGNLNDKACNGVGTEEAPCLITAPEGFDFGVETKGNFLWKGGWFTLGCFLTVESMSIQAGSTANLPVCLTIDRENKYNGFQFDISLPEGITFAKNGDKYAYSLADRYSNDMQVIFNELKGNQWRVMVYSLNNALLTGLDGEAIILSIVVDKSISDTENSGIISNIRLSSINGKSIPVPNTTFNINVTKYQPLYCETEPLRPNKSSNMSIYLSIDYEEMYNGYQFDITLPEGVTLAKEGTSYAYTLADRYTDDMQVHFNELGDNQWRAMVYSLTNAKLTGLEGKIITLSITSDENISDDNLYGTIANFRLSRIDGKSIPLTDVTFNFQVDSSSSFSIGDANHDGEVDASDVFEHNCE